MTKVLGMKRSVDQTTCVGQRGRVSDRERRRTVIYTHGPAVSAGDLRRERRPPLAEPRRTIHHETDAYAPNQPPNCHGALRMIQGIWPASAVHTGSDGNRDISGTPTPTTATSASRSPISRSACAIFVDHGGGAEGPAMPSRSSIIN